MNTPAPPTPPPSYQPPWYITLWQNHGTKLLGGLTALVGTVAVLTPAQFAVYGVDGHTALRITAIASGLLTVLRGFANTASKSNDNGSAFK